jgi:hypothetical protein
VEAGGGRRRGRGGQRLLYWFRTPPGVRVGRAALDDEAIRLIEQHNPDIQFDWARLLKESAPEAPRREREGRDVRDSRDRERRERRDTRQPPRPRPMETSAAAAPPLRTPEAAEEMQALAEAAEQRAADHAQVMAEDDAERRAAESADYAEQKPLDPESAAASRLGPEGLRRLQSRYLDLKTRLEQKDDLDADARAELGAALERLNPDAWQTSEEVSAALEQYESIFERVRSVVGRHPRRRV